MAIQQLLLLLWARAAALRDGDPTPPSLSLCAIGDLHGDALHAMEALRLCEAIDASGRWVGGALTVVQVGDVLDRGNASLPLVHRLWKLQEEASAAGGELLMLVGNHELLNMQGATRYVHKGELRSFGGAAAWQELMHPQRGEGGRRLAAQPAVAVRGEGACRTLFLHAGLRPSIAAQCEKPPRRAASSAALTLTRIRTPTVEQVRDAERAQRRDARSALVGPDLVRRYARARSE